MSTTYPYYSNTFPDDIDNFDQFRDPEDSEMYLVNQYYYFLDKNMLTEAKGILTDNPNLKEVIVNADRLNLLRDSLLSIEEYYRDNIQNLDNVFIATYGTAGQQGVTTSAEIEEAYQAGKACFCVYNGRCYSLSYRDGTTKHHFSVVYGDTRYSVHCENNRWSVANSSTFATTSALTSGLATKQDTLPSQTSNAGKFLTTDGSALSWGNIPDNVFIAVYDNTNGTTHAEIEAAVNAKKFVYCYWSDRLYSLAYKDTTSNTFYFYAWQGSIKYQITCNTSNQWSNTSTTYSTSSHTHSTYAPINSPSFTGTPRTVDIDANSPSNQIANKAYVDAHSGGNGVYFVDYGTTTTGMIDAYNAGKLVITSFGNSFCYLMYSNDIQYYFYSIDCDINSVYNSPFYHRFIECVAIYDSLTETLSWESASYPVHNTYEAVYGDTTQDGFLNLGVCYSRKYCIYCYYNNKIYYLTNKSEDSNQISYYFTNINNGVQSTVICTKNLSNNTISWDYSSSTLVTQTDLTNGLATKQDLLPSITGNSGKFLMTNGTIISWENIAPQMIVPCTYGVTKSQTIQDARSAGAIPCITSIPATVPAFLPSVRVLFFSCNKDGYHCFTGMDETYGLVIAKCLITNDITQNAEWSYTTISINAGASSPAFSVVEYNSATTTQINSLISQGKIVLCRLDRGAVNYNYTKYLLTLVYYDNTKAIFSSGINESSPEILTATCENDVWSYQISTVATPEYVGNRVFVATYNSTAVTEIEEAYQANKVIVCKWGQTASQQYSILSSRVETTSFDPQTHAEYISRITYEFSQSHYTSGEGYITTFQCRGDANLTTQTFDTTWVSPESLTVQSALTFDTTPTNNSHNPVESGGVYTALSSKLDKSGGTMTGALTLSGAPTANLQAATKKYVDDGLSLKAPINSPAFTGEPTATTVRNPRANTTNLATTAFVQNAIGANIFIAEYNVTSFLDIAEAILTNGCDFILCKRSTGNYTYDYYYCQTVDLSSSGVITFNNIFGGGSANFQRITCSWLNDTTVWDEVVNATLTYN